MNTLSTDSLVKVLNTLEAGLDKLHQSEPDSLDYDLFRNATVKSFELSVEMSGKLLRKALKAFTTDTRAVDSLVFNDVLRTAGKNGLLDADELQRWFNYRRQRNNTAHDYGEKLAENTLKLLLDFEQDARELADRVQKVFDAEH